VRIVKPNHVAVLTRPYDYQNKFSLCVAGLVLFPFAEPRYPLPESLLWILAGKELGATPLDECMPKRRGEILLRARAHAPGGEPRSVVRVAIELDGKLLKEVAVVGNRVWKDGVPTDPEPFSVMDIGWENAFGGPAFKRNPRGKGHRAKDGSPLPNIENPKRLLRSMRQVRDPTGVGPYDVTWPQRRRKAGRYDDEWLKKFYPGFAKDLDWAFFNVAPPDQQLSGFFRGDEEFVFYNLHPEISRLVCKLPEVQLRTFMVRRPRAGEDVESEVSMTLDTVWLFPHAAHGILVYHGTAPVREDDAADVRTLLVACEDLGRPKSREHYGEVLELRLSHEEGPVAALDDRPLLPNTRGDMKGPPSPAGEYEALVAHEFLAYRNMQKKAAKEIERLRDVLRDHGLDPDEHGPPPLEPLEPSGSTEELLARAEALEKAAEEQRQRAEAAWAKQEEELAELGKKVGIDFDEIKKEWHGPGKAGPPELIAEQRLADLRALAEQGRASGFDVSEIDGYLADTKLAAMLSAADASQLAAYRLGAQDQPEPPMRSEEESRAMREDLLSVHAAGGSLADCDLTGARLAGIDLAGADLRNALMERCDLSDSNLSGALLSGAVLARANLTGARLDGADLEGANLSKANCSKASFERVRLTGALLIQVRFASANLDGVDLENAMLEKTALDRCSLRGVNAEGVLFDGMDLTACVFAGAVLAGATFMKCTLDGADFTEANLEDATFYQCRGKGAVFARIAGTSLRGVEGTELLECDFRQAVLASACMRGAKLARCDFTDAVAGSADFSECIFHDARLYHLRAPRALFVRADFTRANLAGADLLGALLSKAILKGADVRGANLYEADLATIQGDKETRLKDAFMVRTRVRPFYSDKRQDID
jgi:uncharacterized protein YjbI with pentapeptide repeats